MTTPPRLFALDHLSFPRSTASPQPPANFPASQKLEIGQINYNAPNFVSNGATQHNLAEALKRELADFSFRNEVKHPDMLAPEMEITVPVMTVKSQATDEEGLAHDTVAAIKQELIRSANSFARYHRMNYEKTGQWPEWYNQRRGPLYEEAIFWQAPDTWRFDPPAGPVAELDIVDKARLLIAQCFALEGDIASLEAAQQANGWSDEGLDRMLPELGLRKWRQTRDEKVGGQESQEPGLLDKMAEVAKEGIEQVLEALGPEEAEAQELGEEDIEAAKALNELAAEQVEVSKPADEEQATSKELQIKDSQDINDTSGIESSNEHLENIATVPT